MCATLVGVSLHWDRCLFEEQPFFNPIFEFINVLYNLSNAYLIFRGKFKKKPLNGLILYAYILYVYIMYYSSNKSYLKEYLCIYSYTQNSVY